MKILTSSQTGYEIPYQYSTLLNTGTGCLVYAHGTTITVDQSRMPAVAGSVTVKPMLENIQAFVCKELDALNEDAPETKFLETTKDSALSFIEQIAMRFNTKPEVSLYPNGEIGFDWENSTKGKIIVQVDQFSLYYFYKGPQNKRRKGSEIWSGTIPEDLMSYLSNVID